MEPWLKYSLLLSTFGFLKEIRPSEPFVYDFLIGHWRNVTEEQVIEEVYPVSTYAQLILAVLVFLITDLTRYKPLIIVLGLSGVAIFSMLLWTTSLFSLQVVEVLYGMFMAAEVAYFTYIYAKVDEEHYRKVTSHTRAAILAGRFISGVSSQVLVSTELMNYRDLNYITLIAISAATIWSLFLPSVQTSVYFHSETSRDLSLWEKSKSAFAMMRKHFMGAFSKMEVLKWSTWWALSTCGYVQVEDFMQPLYSAVQPSDEAAYNGAVEAILTILGFAAAILAGYLKINHSIQVTLLYVLSLTQGVLIIIISQATDIYVCYSLYILFGVLYHFMITIASAKIASAIVLEDGESCYGLVFGVNSFFTLVFNSILTTIVATKGVGFELGARGQYVVYGGYHVIIGVVFALIAWTRRC